MDENWDDDFEFPEDNKDNKMKCVLCKNENNNGKLCEKCGISICKECENNNKQYDYILNTLCQNK